MKYLNKDYGIFRAKRQMHYFLPKHGFGYNPKQQDAKIPLPLSFIDKYLPNYEKFCAIKTGRNDLFICAVPREGGDYLVLKEHANFDDTLAMLKYDGLRNIIEKALELPLTPVTNSGRIKLEDFI
ncbi:hypothetical protein JXM83_04775 [Candidatus Woesearchaeota archaeon]|nr:hypothetical protein [Candidatus Woesearchaeota archaeon]